MQTSNALMWVVDQGPDAAAVHYTARLLSTLVGCTAVIVDRVQGPVNVRTPAVWYTDAPPNHSTASLWIPPDKSFWLNVRAGGDMSPSAAVVWEGVPHPVWKKGGARKDSEGFQGGRCSADPVAATFFLVSRIEEWRCTRTDRHGRFPAADAWMVNRGLIERPLVHEYAAAIARVLGVNRRQESIGSPWPLGHRFAIAYTHDVDRLRMHGPLWQDVRNAAGALRFPGGAGSATRRFWSRLLVRTGRRRDPYDTFDRLVELHDQHSSRATFFWIDAQPSVRNADYLLSHPRIQELMRSLQDDRFEMGLHGSYESFDSSVLLRQERDGVMSASDAPVAAVRQHYLRMRPPDTWQAQIEAGLRVDTSLGFASQFGFRAGLAVPFQPWDFHSNRPFNIWEIPLVMMDGTAREYMRLKPQQAISRSRGLLERVAQVGGAAAVLWHNSSFDNVDWPGWSAVYESWLADTQSLGGWGATVSDIMTAWRDHVVRLGNM